MRELKSYADVYTDIKRSPAFFGPYRRPGRPVWKGILLILIYIVGGILLTGGTK